jgi:hypothetical protein
MGASEAAARALRAPTKRVLVAVAVALALLGVLAFVMAPFRAAGGLKCGSALLGSDPKERRFVGLVAGKEAHYCDVEGKSRLIIAGFATAFTLALGISAVTLPVGLIEDIVTRRH